MMTIEIKDCYDNMRYVVRVDKIRGMYATADGKYTIAVEQLNGCSMYPCENIRASKEEFEKAIRLIRDL